MRSRYVLIALVLVALAFGVGRLSAAVGTVDSPGGPDSDAAKMYTPGGHLQPPGQRRGGGAEHVHRTRRRAGDGDDA